VTTPLLPTERDSRGETRERLLDAAERLFAQKGFAQTSVRDITREARSNVAGINYHFGGKLPLYREVFRRHLTMLRERRIESLRMARSIGQGPGALEAVLRSFALAFLEPLVDRSGGSCLIELISREMLDPQLPPRTFAKEVVDPVHQALAEAILRVTPGLRTKAARLSVVSVVSQLIHVSHRLRSDGGPTSHRIGAFSRSGRKGIPAAACAGSWTLSPLDRLVDHIVRFSAGGIRASLGAPPPPPRRSSRSTGKGRAA
jgi:AcrR family transcriptional regulator